MRRLELPQATAFSGNYFPPTERKKTIETQKLIKIKKESKKERKAAVNMAKVGHETIMGYL